MSRGVTGPVMTALLLMAASPLHAEEITRDVWVFGAQTPNTMRAKAQPFFEAVAAKSGFQYRIVSSTNQATVLDHCDTGEPAIVAASKPIADPLEQRCGYKKILVTRQTAMLFTDRDSSFDWAKKPRIGMISNVDITVIAEEEFKALGHDFQPIYYRDLLDLIRSHKRDKLDAVVVTDMTVQIVSSFGRDKKSIYVFSRKGEAFILVAPTVSQREIDNLIAGFVALSAAEEDNWVRSIGLAGFEPLPVAH